MDTITGYKRRCNHIEVSQTELPSKLHFQPVRSRLEDWFLPRLEQLQLNSKISKIMLLVHVIHVLSVEYISKLQKILLDSFVVTVEYYTIEQ